MNKKRIVVGISGRVDSSITAWLLKQQGYDVVDLFMKNWEDDNDNEYCSTQQDWIDMISVADLIGIDVEAVNFAAEYKGRVFVDFLREYSAGRTLNPDVLCNIEIKFEAFLDRAMALGAGTITTGHYARMHGIDGRLELLAVFGHTKDQSYFLHRLSQAQLSRTLFLLGEMPKTKVRRTAAEIGLPSIKKKDSTGICFIGERPFRDFLNRYLSAKSGPIKTPDGKTISEHVGLAFYTLGQRKGIGIDGSRDGNGDAWYIVHKDMAANTLYIVQGYDHPWLLAHTVHADDLSWVTGQAPVGGANLEVRTRYHQADAPYTVARADDSALALVFPEAQWAVTPGQPVVLYDGEVCLGDGIISAAEPAIIEKAIA